MNADGRFNFGCDADKITGSPLEDRSGEYRNQNKRNPEFLSR
jgi:hypothetical protein